MRPLRLREQMLLGSLGLLAIVVVFYFFVYSPATNEAATLAKQLGRQRTDVARLQKEAQRTKELEGEVADLQNAMRVLEAKLPSAREIPSLLLQLDDLAGQTGVTLISIKPGVQQPILVPSAARTGPPPAGGRPTTPAPGSRPSQGPTMGQPESPAYEKFSIEFEAKGSFSALVKFVHGFEDFPRFLSLSDMRVTRAPAKRGESLADPVLTLQGTATAYVRRANGETP